jgi:hypothetical protein
LKSTSNWIKCEALPHSISPNIPLITVPEPNFILINPDTSVVLECVSTYSEVPFIVPLIMDIFILTALLETISPVVFLKMDWKLIFPGD